MNIFAPTIRRIKKIILVKLVEVIEKILEITTIKTIEIIESMPDITLKGDQGVAFTQSAPGSGSWVSPNGVSDPDTKWSDEAKAYDGNTGTYAQHKKLDPLQWGGYLVLKFSTPIKANKLRFWITNEDERVQIYATVDGAYTPVYQGKLGTGSYVEKSFSQGMVSEIAIRFYNNADPSLYPRVHEANVWQVPTTGGHAIVDATLTLREDLTSFGSSLSSSGAGVVVVEGTEGQKIKVYDAGYESAVDCIHFFYFGTTTTPTNKRFLSSGTKGCFHKTFVQPRIGEAGDTLYLFSLDADTNMPVDVGYVKE